MDNLERRTIRACWWLKRNTKRIERKLEEVFAWIEDPVNNCLKVDKPGYLLNPMVNQTNCWMIELGQCLRQYPCGEMPERALMGYTRMVDVATKFVETLEPLIRAESLHETMTAEIDLYQYMTMRMPEKLPMLVHRANVNMKVEAIMSCFKKNSQALFKMVGDAMNECAKPRGAMKKFNQMEKMIYNIHSVILRDEVEGEHCWDLVNAPRRKQLLLLRAWMEDDENKEKIGYGLSMGCLQSFVVMPGGYPNDRAMYNFAHQHETEFG